MNDSATETGKVEGSESGADPYVRGTSIEETSNPAPEPARNFVVGTGSVPRSAFLAAELTGFATAESCVKVEGRVIYETNPAWKVARAVGVMSEPFAADPDRRRGAFEALSVQPERPPYLRLDDIVTSEEIARRLNVSPATVRKWRERSSSFPDPFKIVGKSGLWEWPLVVAWVSQRSDVPGSVHPDSVAGQE